MTALGAQDLMAAWNATLIPMNEMKTVEASGKGWNAYFVTLAHVLTSGKGRERSEFAKKSDPLLALKFWTAFGVTNGEHSIESMARAAKTSRDLGDIARFIDVLVPPPEKGGIFDRITDKSEGVALASRRLAEQVERTIKANYGVAFPQFIDYVVQNQPAVLAEFTKRSKLFVAKVASEDAWQRRFALKFGYAYAGGRLAIDAGVLGCSSLHLRRSVERIYRKARSSFRTDLELAQAALDKLHSSIDAKKFPRIEKGTMTPSGFTKNSPGFIRRFPKYGSCLAIRRMTLRGWGVTDPAFDQVIDSLKSNGAFIPGRDKKGLTHQIEVGGMMRGRYVLLNLKHLKAMLTADRSH